MTMTDSVQVQAAIPLVARHMHTCTIMVLDGLPNKKKNHVVNHTIHGGLTFSVELFIPYDYGYSPPFPCLTVVGRKQGAGTSSTQIVVRARE